MYGLTGSLAPTRITPAYRLGLLIVAMAMLVLPLLYLGIIAGAIQVLWWHLTSNTWILTGRSGGLWRLVGYFGPAAAGAVVVFFMIKPVLARPARGIDPVEIGPGEQPELHDFIRAISRHVGAPFPRRVQVDCQVNASAGFAGVPWTLREDLVLTIGLPLAAGLTVRQFAGVLAHEFGHFAQTGGMRLTFIVRSINHWLARVAHERDEWDETLEEWARSGTWAVVVTFQFARVAVWISRKILAVLWRAGHVISSFMLRQMEYDADSYEIRTVGTRAFIATSTRMRELNAGAHFGYQDLQNAWARRTLPANLPAFLVGHTGRLPEALLTQIREASDKTSFFDTHPSDTQRLQAAEAMATEGVFVGGDEPASVLFRDFEAVGAAATRHHYSHDLGLTLDSTTLVATDAAVEASRARDEWHRAADALFGESLSFFRAFTLPWPPPAIPADAAAVNVQRARDAMQRGAEAASEKVRRFEELTHARELAATASEVLQAGFTKIVPAEFQLTSSTGADAADAHRKAAAAIDELAPDLQRYDALAVERIASALALLRHEGVLDPAARAALIEEATRVVPPLNALGSAWPTLAVLHHAATTSELVEANAANSPDGAAARRHVGRLAGRVHDLLRRIHNELATTGGPDPSSPATVAALLGFPQKDEDLPSASTVITRAAAMRADLLGRLASVVLRVEEGAPR